MKCDELKSYYYYEDRVITPATHTYRVYHADKVDAAIKELKERIQLDDDEMAGFLDLEEECGGGDLRNYITELKAKLDKAIAERDGNQVCIDALKEKLEEVQASAYAESVDAGMRERRLKRALWLERARRASAWQIHFALSHNHSIKREFTINGASSPHDRMVTMRTARDWAMIWKNVERKCRAKAEEYK